MVMKDQQKDLSKKRKSIPGNKAAKFDSGSKKPKLGGVKSSDPQSQVSKKPFKPPGQQLKPFKPKFQKPGDGKEDVPKTKHELRIQAKELTEARKKKRKRHYSLEQELASLWEKMRRRNVSKEDRSKFVSEALRKMKGKIHEIAGSHVSSRVLQTCVKYCSQAERDSVFEELKPHFLTLSTNTYAVHLVKKMLDNASKKQLAGFISSLHGRVAALLRHMVGSVVVEHAYELGNAANKQELLIELYSTELQLFRDLVSMKESRLTDVISKLGLQKASVQRHMISVIQPILEKGIVDHSIIHRVLVEYFSIADKSSATDVIQLLCSSLLVRMISTKDGSRIGILCVKHGNAKGRKQIIKGMKGLVGKIALDRYGSMVLVSILSTVDDTDRIKKIIIRELQAILKELVFDKNGRNPLLQLLHPNCSRYFNPEDLASLNSSIPSLSAKGVNVTSETKSEGNECDDEETKSDLELPEAKDDENAVEVGKKDPSLRRKELLVDSGLAEKLVDVCTENVGELLLSNFGKEVLYEVATGGSDGILHPVLDEKINILHEEIASLVAIPKSDESEEEHVLENFHSSRTIRKLILDCPTFASTLWKTALKGKCKTWAKGHSSKVICAFLESTDPKVRGLVKKELQPLIDEGILKVPEAKQATN